MPMLQPELSCFDHVLSDLQDYASEADMRDWEKVGAQIDPKTGLLCKEGKVCIPMASASLFIA